MGTLKKQMAVISSYLMLLLVFFVSGCIATVQTGSLQGVTHVRSENRSGAVHEEILGYSIRSQEVVDPTPVRPGHGRIFIIRPKVGRGWQKGTGFFISVNEKRTNSIIGDGGCLTWEQPVGRCAILCDQLLCDIMWVKAIGPLEEDEIPRQTIQVEDGHFYYLQLCLEQKPYRLNCIEENAGKSLVGNCRVIGVSP